MKSGLILVAIRFKKINNLNEKIISYFPESNFMTKSGWKGIR